MEGEAERKRGKEGGKEREKERERKTEKRRRERGRERMYVYLCTDWLRKQSTFFMRS